METSRVPFHMTEAESELVGGATTELGGLVYGLTAAVEYLALVSTLLIGTQTLMVDSNST